jgi:hypothetical protein
MNHHLAALRESIIAETLSIYPDFHFFLSPDKNGNLTVDYRGTWEPQPDPHDTPYLTIEHDGDRFLVSHYLWNERRKYKTFKGAAKYINDELQGICDRNREQKAKADAEREHEEKSIQLLRNFHERLASHGIASKLCIVANRYNNNHLSVEAERINSRIDITVTSDYRLEMVFAYPRFYAAPETAADILSALSKKVTA